MLDTEHDVIPKSIQLIAGRTAQEYNQRKKRNGAYWEDRYHATAVKSGKHLIQCMVYIDLNMVRAGVVQHPAEWPFSGYNEIQTPGKRYNLINRQKLLDVLGIEDRVQFCRTHKQWNDELLGNGSNIRDPKWTESIAVGSREFLEETKTKLGIRGKWRKIVGHTDECELKESQTPYSNVFDREKYALSPKNSYFWNLYPENTI